MRRSSDPVARRRLNALLAVGALSGLGGLVVGAGGGDSAPVGAPATGRAGPAAGRAQPPPRRPALGEQVGQLVLLRFTGPQMPPYVRDILRERRAAGVVLFGDNVVSAPQLRALTRALQRAAGGRALISVDQEGGPIRNVDFAGPPVGQPTQGAPAAVEAAARGAGAQLRALGVNVNLAPVADIPAGPGSIIRGRAFAGRAPGVAAATRAAARGYAGARVAATVKHFPGLGGATVNTDDGPATVRRTHADMASADLAPFRAGIEGGAGLVMAGHALYPAYDSRRIASQSPVVIDGLLRRELGFRGAVVTDSLEARAVLARSPVDEAALRSLRAGCDLLLLTGAGSYRPVYRRLLAEAGRAPDLRARVATSAGRVDALRERLGLRRSTR